MMNQKQGIALVVALVIVTSAALIVIVNTPAAPDVRIGYLSQDIHQLALRVAIVNGFFEEAGLKVDLYQYQNGAYEMDGFQGGQIDMGYLGAAPAIVKSINQEIAVTVLAAVNLEGSAISVLKSEYDEGRITSVADLAGKTVYHPGPATVQNFLLRLALNQSGLTINDINAETARVQDMALSLTPDAPAYIAWEPFPSLSEYDNITVPLVLSGEIWPRHPCCVVGASDSFIEAHPDIVQKVINVHVRAEKWIQDNPAEALQIAIDWLEVAPEAVENAFNRVIFDYALNVTGLEMYLSYLIDESVVEMDYSEMPTFLNGFVNQTFLDVATSP